MKPYDQGKWKEDGVRGGEKEGMREGGRGRRQREIQRRKIHSKDAPIVFSHIEVMLLQEEGEHVRNRWKKV